jgi:hypothetical protein
VVEASRRALRECWRRPRRILLKPMGEVAQQPLGLLRIVELPGGHQTKAPDKCRGFKFHWSRTLTRP